MMVVGRAWSWPLTLLVVVVVGWGVSRTDSAQPCPFVCGDTEAEWLATLKRHTPYTRDTLPTRSFPCSSDPHQVFLSLLLLTHELTEEDAAPLSPGEVRDIFVFVVSQRGDMERRWRELVHMDNAQLARFAFPCAGDQQLQPGAEPAGSSGNTGGSASPLRLPWVLLSLGAFATIGLALRAPQHARRSAVIVLPFCLVLVFNVVFLAPMPGQALLGSERLARLAVGLAPAAADAGLQGVRRFYITLARHYQCVEFVAEQVCSGGISNDVQYTRPCSDLVQPTEAGHCALRSSFSERVLKFKVSDCDHPIFACDSYYWNARATQAVQGPAPKLAPAPASVRGAASAAAQGGAPRAILVSTTDAMMVGTWVLVNVVREHGCQLPIELWSLEGETSDTELARQLARTPGVTFHTVDASAVSGGVSGYFVKPLILLQTTAKQVLLLDSDNVPFRDPTFLFDTEAFLELGAVFWPDFWHPDSGKDMWGRKITPKSPIWDLVDFPFYFSHEHESGQILLDRTRHAKAIRMAAHMAEFQEVYTRENTMHGDKDFYRFAFHALDRPFHLVPHPPADAGAVLPTTEDAVFCGMTMVQFDDDGRVLFLHRNQAKIHSWRGQMRWWDTLQVAEPGAPLHLRFVGRAVRHGDHVRFEQRETPATTTCYQVASPHRTVRLSEESEVCKLERHLLRLAMLAKTFR